MGETEAPKNQTAFFTSVHQTAIHYLQLQSEGDLFLTEHTMSAFEDRLLPQLSLLCPMHMEPGPPPESILGNGFRSLPVPTEVCSKVLSDICPFSI